MDVLVISPRDELWNGLAPAFAAHNLQPHVLASFEEGLQRVRSKPPVLLILDNPEYALPEQQQAHIETTRKALTEMLMVNAMVHSAVTSFLDEESFHDAMEGFGILCGLPLNPGTGDIDMLAQALRSVLAS